MDSVGWHFQQTERDLRGARPSPPSGSLSAVHNNESNMAKDSLCGIAHSRDVTPRRRLSQLRLVSKLVILSLTHRRYLKSV